MDRLLTREELARHLNRPVRTIDSWRFRGRGPAKLRLRTRQQGGPRFSLDDLAEWQAAVERTKEKRGHQAVRGQSRAHAEAMRRLRSEGVFK